jgi:hypothetical protein
MNPRLADRHPLPNPQSQVDPRRPLPNQQQPGNLDRESWAMSVHSKWDEYTCSARHVSKARQTMIGKAKICVSSEHIVRGSETYGY